MFIAILITLFVINVKPRKPCPYDLRPFSANRKHAVVKSLITMTAMGKFFYILTMS